MRLAFVLSFLTGAYSVVVWGPGEERALVGDSLTVSCRYTNYVENVKYWSRDNMWGKGFLVKTDGTTNDNRISITDNKAARVFSVTMKDLKEDDDGWYHCGISIPGVFEYDQTSLVHISVKKVQAPKNVMNQTKGKVTVRCKYHKSYTDSVKYWCKDKLLLLCSTLVKTGGTDTHGKISIRDDKTEGAFYITMTDLAKDDEGPYKCGISQFLFDEKVSVYVRVNEGDTMPDLWGPRNVSGMASSSETITCQYAADYTKSVKYWCKDSGADVCSPEVNTHDKEREDRTQIRDDPSNREFVITIRNLTGNDTGLYYCGMRQSSSHKDNRVPVNLNVDAVKAQVEPIPASTTEKGSTYVTNHSDRKSSPMLVPLAVSFGVLLLLCCVAALITCKIKYNIRPAVADKGEKPPAANELTLQPPAANEPTYEEVTNDSPMSDDSVLEPSVCLYSVVNLQQRTGTPPPADQVLYSTINSLKGRTAR